jgi:hypothetical protein
MTMKNIAVAVALSLSLISGSALPSGYGWSKMLEGAVDGMDAVERRHSRERGTYDYQNPYGNSQQEENRKYQEEHLQLLNEQNNLLFMQGGRSR